MMWESQERTKELVEGARNVYQEAEYGEAAAKGWRGVRDGSKAQRKPN